MYLKAAHSWGNILNPSYNPKIGWYQDVDFGGMYGNDKITDLAFVESRTCYIITITDCPVI